MLYANGTRIERAYAGAQELQYIYQGSNINTHEHMQFCKIPSNYLSLNLDLGGEAIVVASSSGSRSPADKITNYCYVNSSQLTIGKKYAYLIATAGERPANRQLSDGTVISCRGYNDGGLARINALTMQHVEDKTYYNKALYNYQGCFIYNPKTIVSGSGSAFGHLIAKNTYNVSDPGKGGIKAYIYEYTALKSLFAYAKARDASTSWDFNETIHAN
jgi:hypothetical protein